MDREVLAAVTASLADVDLMTSDRIEALTKGHGMLNISVFCIANVIAEELSRGTDVKITFANAPHIPLEDTMRKCVQAAREAGADAVNAALLSAVMVYFAGSNVQAGIPAGNRKLGAMARIIAGVDRSGVAAIPTPKAGNKISAFPAVQAIYEAMQRGELSPVDGSKLPFGVAGLVYGHSVLGEDIIFPHLAREGARIGTEAMLQSYAGAGMAPNRLICAILGSAAILEIVHPDAHVGPAAAGAYGEVTSVHVAGQGAAKAADLPDKLHFRGAPGEIETARLIGELGLILKDIGAPSVVGMIAFEDILGIFAEPMIGGGAGGGPVQAPLGHVCTDAVIALRTFIEGGCDTGRIPDVIGRIKDEEWLDPEQGKIALNIVARKAEQVRRGPITRALIFATEGARVDGAHWRAKRAYQALMEGRELVDVVRTFDDMRLRTVQSRWSAMLSQMMGTEVTVEVKKFAGRARRPEKFLEKFAAFDVDADVDVTIGDQRTSIEGLAHKVIPRVAKGEDQQLSMAIGSAAVAVNELGFSGAVILNVTVPAAVAAAMGKYTPVEAAALAEEGGYLTASIPGSRERAVKVAELAQRICHQISE